MSTFNRRSAEEVVRAIYRAVDLAKNHNHEAVTLEHLLASLIEESDVQDCLTALSVNRDLIADQMTLFMEGGFVGHGEGEPATTKSFDEVVTRAIAMGAMSRDAGGKPMPIHILVQLAQAPIEDSFALNALRQAGLDSLALKRHLSHGLGSDSGSQAGGSMGGMDDMMGGSKDIVSLEDALVLLSKYTVNLNEAAAEGQIDPLIGREEEVSAIIQIVARRTKNNVALIGEPGVGKTAIAEGLAKKILEAEVPTALLDAEVFSLDIGSLMAGTRFRGDLEERMKQVLKALTFVTHPILFIDEIHTIMGTGSGNQGSLDIANLLKPALAKGTLRCVGSTTYEEYRKHFEKDRALLRRFKRVDVKEPDVETAKLILRGLRTNYEEFHGVTFTDAAIDAAVDLTNRYVTNALLPDKAIDIIDNAGARQKVAEPDKRIQIIDVEQIEFEVSKVAKIPEQSVKEDEGQRLVRLESDLQSAVFGQDKALAALADAVFVSRSGLRDTNKPAGAFLFAGPTGVGKTEAARQLAATLGVPLLKFDMSEFMEKHSVAKLIGSPPGYVGYGDGASGSGKLVNDVESHPYSVLLLDEMEKAHPDVFNIFLQVMDDGKLTNSTGKTVDFRNVIVIMTTNAGARELTKNAIGFAGGPQKTGGDPTAEINRTFSPEFRNRLDTTVQFDRLDPSHIERVVVKFIGTLSAQAMERGVTIEISDEAKALLAKLGYDRDMGARPLARAINEHVKKPLSRLMVVGNLKDGGTAYVGVRAGGIVVSDEPVVEIDVITAEAA
jgi:ATP-dependent Clp protease ATP-binding subunit ClpA